MLLRVGVIMMAFSVTLALAVAAGLALRDGAEGKVVPVEPVAAEDFEEPLPPAPPVERAEPVEEPAPPPPPEEPVRRTAPPPSEPPPQERPAPELPPQPPPQPVVQREEWPLPAPEEEPEAPRTYAPVSNAALTLTIPSLGVHNAPVFDSDAPQALNAGVGHVPETSMPWDGGAQRNVYLAAHRLGYEGTGSRLLFYSLDRLGRGDEVILEGRGQVYRYRVTEKLVVDPDDSWVMGQVRGRDMVSLQTCTPIPTFEKRLVVRADRV